MAALTYLYLGIVLVLALYGAHRSFHVAVISRKRYQAPEVDKVTEWPSICVQLPLYNEASVAERLLETVSKLNYPAEKFEVQVLDDSTDETQEIVVAKAKSLRDEGLNITVLHRKDRTGFKAGALAAGLKQTKAELIAIFDADFVPHPDFLKKTIPHLLKSKVAFVQARWGHLNRNYSLLTRAQAVLLDAHFVVEQAARSLMNVFFNCNGTAVVWRKEAIEQAGGWEADTLTEDLDLSYRAWLAGWRAVFLRDIVCEAELPETVSAFKSQQYRWAKGTAQVFKKIFPRLITADVPFRIKRETFFHLTAHFCFVLVLLVALMLVPVAAWRAKVYFAVGSWFELIVFFCTFGSVCFYYASSQFVLFKRLRLIDVVAALVLGMGISAHCARAVISGLLSDVGEFVRTPKAGFAGSKAECEGKNFFALFYCATWTHRSEFILSLYLSLGIGYLIYTLHYLTIPFVGLILSGYLMVLVSATGSSKRLRTR